MERIINMFEDGVFNNHSNLIVNNDNNNSVDTKTNALDLFAPEEEEEEEKRRRVMNHLVIILIDKNINRSNMQLDKKFHLN